MNREFKFNPVKSYIMEDAARKAANNLIDDCAFTIVRTSGGRFSPLFYGQTALNNAAHIAGAGFTVVA